MRTHIRILGWLHLVLGAMDLFLALLIFGVFAGIGVLVGMGGEPVGFLVTGLIGTLLGGLMGLTAVPNFLAGWGLLQHRNWARWLALLLGALNVFKFPWGTAVGVYTFVVLLDDESKAVFGAL
ncbi:MAG: hypothetical protein P8188_08765 [Gemmatimonadota bacterium]